MFTYLRIYRTYIDPDYVAYAKVYGIPTESNARREVAEMRLTRAQCRRLYTRLGYILADTADPDAEEATP